MTKFLNIKGKLSWKCKLGIMRDKRKHYFGTTPNIEALQESRPLG
jgi:hypothetical protein